MSMMNCGVVGRRNRYVLRHLLFAVLSFLGSQWTLAQNVEDKFSLGIRGGPNLWVNDMNDRLVSVGFEGFGRYGITKYFSFGITFGFEALKAGQVPLDPPDFPVDFLRSRIFTYSIGSWLYLAPGSTFSPYFFLGVGATSYARSDGGDQPFPNEGASVGSSIYIPLSFGFESFVTNNTAVSFEMGFRFLDQETENVATGSTDGFSSAKVGVSFYFGSNDDDDDDGDGISNGQEKEMGLDPLNADTDQDGLNDGEELKVNKTNPLKEDTDRDGLKDGDEVWRFRTDPLRADSDKDGLSDGEEVSKWNTDPLKVDTDRDGLSDGEEVLTYRTDPLKQDSDDDGISDSNELFGYKTNPNVSDTDGGGVSDGDELKQGTNPLNAKDDQVKVPLREQFTDAELGNALSVGRITFAVWSAILTPESEETLLKVLETLTKNPDIEIEIRGYTDDRGSRDKNIRLSRERAEAVKQWLETRGIPGNRLNAKGLGPQNPLASNSTQEGREQNRRIEFIRTK